jgi:hypothetical protein
MATVLQVGGLYAGRNADGTWTIMKIIAVDIAAVHIRTYANKFPAPPKDIDPSVLSMGSIHDPMGFGIGHLPIAKAGFLAEKPVLIKVLPVTEEELEGYRYYLHEMEGSGQD